MKTLILWGLVCYCATAIAQNPKFGPRYDNVWLMGYDSYGTSLDWGGTRIDFSTNPPAVTREDRQMDFYLSTGSMSGLTGNLLFYTNGYYIVNAQNDTMPGGKNLNPDPTAYQDRITQGILILPTPGLDSAYYIIHDLSTFDPTPYSFIQIYRCLYSKIDMRLNNGLGEMTVNKSFIKDTLCYGKLTACKHANGRDWWILIPKWNSALYFTFLLTPTGLESYGTQLVGAAPISSLGQSVLSPDGTKYARYNDLGSLGGWLDVYDFDRCSGMLSNPKTKHFDIGGAPGVAVSLNSRYLYLSNGLWFYQYDLSADDIIASEILLATYDGYLSPINTYFFLLQLAPDGKIYMNSASTVNVLHIINQPDRPGATCRFEQHGVQLPTLNNASLPNFPNYRLGPLDGSPCDTLGLNNYPVAHFRWEFWDTLSPLHVYFTDLSIYEPAEWHWNFGDGTTSTEKDPEHEYAAPGEYPVCLYVRNTYGADTACYTLKVGVSSNNASPPPVALEVSVVPNPFQSVLAFSVPTVETWQRVDVLLYDMTGRKVAHTAWRGAHSDWHLEALPSSVYFYELITDDGRRSTGKVLKL